MEPQTIKPQRYNNLDGLRTLAAIGVICMHVRANIGFEISGADCPKTQISLFESTTCCAMEEAESLHVVPQETEIRVFGQLGGGILDYLINTLIAQMGGFVQLFYILSGFSMCCGYYEKIKNNQISLNKFYSRRYEKILPFFTLLVLIDLAVGLLLDGGISLGSLAEAFADLTLMFGFYTTSGMSVIGVGWTLGIIFGFYILFPFFVYLIWDKKRAWFSLLLTNVIYLLCVEYFQSGSSLTFRWMCYFVLGGLIYLYKDSIGRFFANKTWLGLVFIIAGFGIVYMIPFSGTGALETVIRLLKNLTGYTLMLFGTLCSEKKLWSNPFSKFVSRVSLEIYIAHMLIFRMIEKVGLTTIAGENVVSYIIACAGTIAGALIFAVVYQYIEEMIKKKSASGA